MPASFEAPEHALRDESLLDDAAFGIRHRDVRGRTAGNEQDRGGGGGRIGAYLSKYEALRKSGQHVAIDGTCASACTLLLGVIPHDRICVTPRAVLAFHAAWNPSMTGAQINTAGTKYLLSRYPEGVRRWIARHGGLRSQTIYLGGRELAAMFQTCR